MFLQLCRLFALFILEQGLPPLKLMVDLTFIASPYLSYESWGRVNPEPYSVLMPVFRKGFTKVLSNALALLPPKLGGSHFLPALRTLGQYLKSFPVFHQVTWNLSAC